MDDKEISHWQLRVVELPYSSDANIVLHPIKKKKMVVHPYSNLEMNISLAGADHVEQYKSNT